MALFVSAVFLLLAAAGVIAQDPVLNRNPCVNKACDNGGTCISPLDFPICQCVSGFGGRNCENRVPVKVGRCGPDPFPGQLNCTPGCDNDYSCPDNLKCCNTGCERQCTDQFILDPCDRFVCFNGGSCNAPADAPFCECPAAFTGDRCENYIPDGTCPEPGEFSVCGGVPCSVDSECQPNQRCCNLSCGTFCTSAVYPQSTTKSTPTTTPQPTLPCFFTKCGGGVVCRNVVEYPGCKLTARCIPPTNFPGDIDNACRTYGYSEAILQKSKSNRDSYNQLLCKKGRSAKCPDGSFCVSGGKGTGICCAVKIN